jgi:putative transposase
MNQPFLKGYYYHIFNRGCNRENIFFNEDNYVYLLRKIKASHVKYGANIVVYCLMPNHYHFLVRQETDRPLSDWIQMLFNGYVQAVNKQQGRKGTLFEGAAKHILVDNEAYLIHLVRYIHYNPVSAHLVRRPEDWQYSNYPEWISIRNGTLVDRNFISNYFYRPDDYRRFMKNYTIESEFGEKLKPYLLD